MANPEAAATLVEGLVLSATRAVDDRRDFARAERDLSQANLVFRQNLLGTKHPLEDPTWNRYVSVRDYVARVKRDKKAQEFLAQRGPRVIWQANEWDNAGNWSDVLKSAGKKTVEDVAAAGKKLGERGYDDLFKLAALAVVLYVGIPAVMRGLRK